MIEYKQYQPSFSIYWNPRNIPTEPKIICIANKYQQIKYITKWVIAMREIMEMVGELEHDF